VCHTWQDYADWMHCLEQAATHVGLRSWRFRNNRQESTGGGNHLLLGGPNLDDNPFFSRPAWLVGLLRYWQHHPSLAYLFNGRSVGPASQAPRPDEGSASRLDLQLALHTLERLPDGDQRVAIGETLRHLHADRSGNTHRSEISLDKFWNPAWSAGCQGLLEFRAIETLPDHRWSSAVALLFRALAVRLLEPNQRPVDLHPWGESLHDRAMLPSELWRDLETVLADLTRSGLALDHHPFRAIWDWRFPVLLHWCSDQVQLWVRQARPPPGGSHRALPLPALEDQRGALPAVRGVDPADLAIPQSGAGAALDPDQTARGGCRAGPPPGGDPAPGWGTAGTA